jgi:hypothetical protein
MSEQTKFLLLRIEALELENERLKKELYKPFKTKISDPNFDKPLNQIETIYEQVTASIHGNS